ncbi:MAG TPA: type II toxin-antitoxin system PemK/MazF family toxin [Tepidiformaceae bacterium]|nr:type II toxin-antitoxin system PemK/MazF family toxin [Tepidiformaceae bacterium]
MRRGEIWTVAAGAGYGAKPRPAVLIQDDQFADTNSVTVCLLTSDPSDVSLIRVELTPSLDNGLESASRLMVDKIITVPRARLGRRVGMLADDDIAMMNQAIVLFLGLNAPVEETPAE